MMNQKQFQEYGRKLFCLVGLISLILSVFCLTNAGTASAQGLASGSPSPAVSGMWITVTNTSEDINGDTSSPAALIANPGPDGISLSEAITAAEATVEYDAIQFDAALSGAVINVVVGLPVIGQGNLMINGDINEDGTPDIILDGSSSARDTGFILYGASHVAIRGFEVRNFSKNGISISPNKAGGAAVVEDISIYQNTISYAAMTAIEVGVWMQDHTAIRDVEIVSNILLYNHCGVSVYAGMGDGAMDNEISGIKILSNTIDEPGYTIGVFISPSSWNGLSRNTIRDVEIRGNLISEHSNSSILVDSSNQASCNDNVTEDIVIADNRIDGQHVTIEIVGASGFNAMHNRISNIAITGNTLTGGGIQFSVATNMGTNYNLISGVTVDRNHISACLANGIYMIAGSGGAQYNRLENVVLRSNFINDCSDAGILMHGDTSYSPNNTIDNVTLTNLTLVNNGNSWAGGLNINTKDASNTITGVSLANSILWGNEGGDAIRGALVPDSVSYSLLGDVRFLGTNDNIYVTPGFADAATGDYRLQAGSPCVDTGDPSGASIGAQDLAQAIRLWDGNGDASAVVDRGAWEYSAIAIQDMDVLGNGIAIPNGDIVPVLWDGTDFGAAGLGGEPVQQGFTIENSGAAALNLSGEPRVEISGTDAGDFAVVSQPDSPVNGGESLTFTIEFTPGATGLREATLSIASDDPDEAPYTFSIQGSGVIQTIATVEKIYLPLVLRPAD
jgi:hypothetical protein